MAKQLTVEQLIGGGRQVGLSSWELLGTHNTDTASGLTLSHLKSLNESQDGVESGANQRTCNTVCGK